jgi:hypothetical protein
VLKRQICVIFMCCKCGLVTQHVCKANVHMFWLGEEIWATGRRSLSTVDREVQHLVTAISTTGSL